MTTPDELVDRSESITREQVDRWIEDGHLQVGDDGHIVNIDAVAFLIAADRLDPPAE